MIALHNIGKNFAGKWAVQGLSMEVKAGEVFGLLGPNGAGKTTVIKMMTGLLRPTSGMIELAGHDIAVRPIEAKTCVGYIPDRAYLYEKLTMRELLHFTASIYGLPKDNAVAVADELIERFGLAGCGDDLIENASQGMRQRLLFASALIHQPRILIIDEPFVGLDPFGVLLIKDVIKGLCASGVAVFIATHSLHIAADVCHRVGLMNQGRLINVIDREEFTGGALETLFIKTVGDNNGA